MASLPSMSQVAGPNLAAYESFFRQVDKNGTGKIGAVDAAAFLKKSGLRETVLHKIWEQSDPHGRGYLDKQGFTVALKLIALAQSGKEVALSGITFPAPVPNLSGTPVHMARSGSPAMGDFPWIVSTEEKIKYDGIFDNLSPIDNKLSGDKVKGIFMNSKLPVDVLSRIWDLSDIDKDGLLDRDEFAVAMHMVYKALEKEPVPIVLPPKLIPPSKRKKASSLPGAIPVLPGAPPSVASRRVTPSPPSASQALRSASPSLAFPVQAAVPASPWVVTAEEKSNCDILFKQLDAEMKGYLTGDQVRPSLIETGLHHQTLAHIWNLCDIKMTGQLNSDQFALAMYLVKQAKSGIMPPPQLSPEMIPPTFRPKPGGADFTDLTSLGAGGLPGDFSAIKELDAISKEIDALDKQKGQLQSDIRDKEEVIKDKHMEVQGLQTELDKSTAQVRQLENQKAEAQRRLDDLDQQKTKLEGLLSEVQVQCQEVQKSVDSLRGQISSQQSAVKNQEEELKKAQAELITLRKEEQQLELQVESGKSQLTTVEESLNQTNTQITELHTKLASLRESKTKLNGTMSQISQALETANSLGSIPQIDEYGAFSDTNKFGGLSTDDIFSSRATAGSSSPVSSLSGFSITSEVNSKAGDIGDDKDDPFKGKDPFASIADAQAADPFQSEDPFKEADPFKEGGDPFKSESGGGDPFKSDAFSANPFGGDPFKSDLFGGQEGTTPTANMEDPFGSKGSSDPFASSPAASDPFAGSSTTAAVAKDPFKTSDPFGSKSEDPFASNSSTNLKGDLFAGAGAKLDGDPFASTKIVVASPLSSGDPFASKSGGDPFSTNNSSSKSSDDPFVSAVSGSNGSSDPFGGGATNSEDPFKGSDPFASDSIGGLTNGSAESKSSDPFGSIDPFGGSAFKTDSFSKSPSTDTFGSDPFNRQEETAPTPALPPKKSRGSGGSGGSTKPPATSPSNISTGSDPFLAFSSADSSTLSDPFAKVESPAAGAGGSNSDPFASTTGGSGGNSDPFASVGSASSDPFASKDPFGGGGGSMSGGDPFATGGKDPFGGSASVSISKDSNSADPFGNFADFGSAKFEVGSVGMTEEEQLVWAVTEAQKEEERQKKLAAQEENDLKMALQLSQEDAGSSEA